MRERGFRYNLGGIVKSEKDIISEAYKHAETISDPDTRRAYLETLKEIFQTERMKDKFKTIVVPIIGIVLLIGLVILAFYNPFPSLFQSQVYWIALALAAAAAAAMIPGFLEVKYQNIIRGTGAIGVFVMIYLMRPSVTENFNIEDHKIQLYLVEKDTTSYDNIIADIDPNSNISLCEEAFKTVNTYYGYSLSSENYTCFNKSDGKIITNQQWKEINNPVLLIISNSLISNFQNKRAAFLHYSPLLK